MPALRSVSTFGRAALSVVVLMAVLAGLLWAPFTPSPAAAAGPTEPSTRISVVTAHSATYTDDKHARTNYARKTTLRVSKARFAGYLAFPAPALQAGETITGARLVLTVTKANKVARKSGGIRVTPVATGWAASGVTGKAAPKALAGAIAGPVRARQGRVSLSFTGAEATSYLAGGSAVRLRHSASRAEVRIAARGSKAPVLEFTIAAAPTTPGEVTPSAPGPTTSSTPPVPDARQFSIAVLPDTQKETMYASNTRFANRTKWLVDNRAKLNLKYVLHTGDVVNWGWLVPSQFTIAKAAVKRLADAGIPYSLTIGNHDTAAVGWNGKAGSTGYGGSAYAYNPECKVRLSTAECRSRLLVRKTAEFNKAFPVSTIE
ncbi:MAG TPA: DNRLRE domain-containing protein, partial [Propionicimonas sp.]